jgi:branched-chain amino acid transport system substrate-binding protein
MSMPELPITVGVMLPRSRSCPQLGPSFLAGLQLALAQRDQQLAGRPIRLVVEEIGMGLAFAEQKARKLLSADLVDVAVGLLPVNLAAALQPLFAAQQVCLIACHAGENIPRRDEQGPFCFQNSLALWQANYALGARAAAQLGRRAIMAQSFYDSGYDLPFAFRLGYEQAGGEVLRTFLTHRPPDPGSFGPIFELAEREAPDLLFASYSGRPARDFLQAYAAAGPGGRVPLLGSAFLIDDQQLQERGEALLGAQTAIGWDAGADAARPFAAAFLAQTGRSADGFAALGYEAASWLAAAVDTLGGDLTGPERTHEALAGATIDGPRGRLQIEPETRCALPAAITLRETRRHGDALVQAPIAALPLLGIGEEPLAAVRDNLRSGWFNPYLCA